MFASSVRWRSLARLRRAWSRMLDGLAQRVLHQPALAVVCRAAARPGAYSSPERPWLSVPTLPEHLRGQPALRVDPLGLGQRADARDLQLLRPWLARPGSILRREVDEARAAVGELASSSSSAGADAAGPSARGRLRRVLDQVRGWRRRSPRPRRRPAPCRCGRRSCPRWAGTVEVLGLLARGRGAQRAGPHRAEPGGAQATPSEQQQQEEREEEADAGARPAAR